MNPLSGIIGGDRARIPKSKKSQTLQVRSWKNPIQDRKWKKKKKGGMKPYREVLRWFSGERDEGCFHREACFFLEVHWRRVESNSWSNMVPWLVSFSHTTPLCWLFSCHPSICHWSLQITLINSSWPGFCIHSSLGSLYTFFHFVCLLWSPLLAVGGLIGSGSPWACQPTSRVLV